MDGFCVLVDCFVGAHCLCVTTRRGAGVRDDRLDRMGTGMEMEMRTGMRVDEASDGICNGGSGGWGGGCFGWDGGIDMEMGMAWIGAWAWAWVEVEVKWVYVMLYWGIFLASLSNDRQEEMVEEGRKEGRKDLFIIRDTTTTRT